MSKNDIRQLSDAPRIEQEQTFIHTRENDETEVICIVHASPKAEVSWFKNGKPLRKDEGIFSQRSNRHILLLPGIKGSTFGTYSCKATNKFGSDERTTQVSGEWVRIPDPILKRCLVYIFRSANFSSNLIGWTHFEHPIRLLESIIFML